MLVLGSLAVVLFDGAASLLSLQGGFAYSSAAWGSYVLYVAVGFFAARAGGVWSALRGGVVVGLVDASLGWGLSWFIGPGRPPSGVVSLASWTTVAIIVTITAAMCAAVGALGNRIVGPPAKFE